mgnify:CR=1 FL=1
MSITCPECKKNKLEEVSKIQPLVCENCGREYYLEFTGKIYQEGE